MVFHWSLSDNKSSQVSSIQAGLSNAVTWIVSTCALISKSSAPFTNPLMIVPRAPIAIGITITFMFHSFSIPSAELLSLLFAFFQFYSVLSRDYTIIIIII